jgi:hypothetical protein
MISSSPCSCPRSRRPRSIIALLHHHFLLILLSCVIEVYILRHPPLNHKSATKTKTRPAGVAQSVERVALIFSDISKPQGRGFEPLLRLFLSYVAGDFFLHYLGALGKVCGGWWWEVRMIFFAWWELGYGGQGWLLTCDFAMSFLSCMSFCDVCFRWSI